VTPYEHWQAGHALPPPAHAFNEADRVARLILDSLSGDPA
jgi:hypothetical protein